LKNHQGNCEKGHESENLKIRISEKTKLRFSILVQSAKKERTNELNSKFDKTYKIFSKSYHNLISKESYCLFFDDL
jgi:hypothetical protein